MTQTEANAQVVAMLELALADARGKRAIACDVHLVHGDTTSSYRVFNSEAFASAQELLEAQHAGGTQ
jgi:hypothetical protein